MSSNYFLNRAAKSYDVRSYPGLYSSAADLTAAQAAAARWAAAQDDPQRALDDERERRYRAFFRSAVNWVVFGIPALAALLLLLSSWASGLPTSDPFRP